MLDTRSDPSSINGLPDFNALDVEVRSSLFKHAQRGSHDLRADAIPIRDCDRCFVHTVWFPLAVRYNIVVTNSIPRNLFRVKYNTI